MQATTFDLAKQYTLTPEQISAYRRDGHICLREVASREEVECFRPVIEGLVDEGAHTSPSQGVLEDTSVLFSQVTNVWQKSESVRELIFAERFARIAGELMGVKRVRLYHDQALIKDPGGRPSPWHKDHYYWPLATHQTVKMWLALVDISRERGSMCYASGSHRGGLFPELPIMNNSQDLYDQIIRDHNIEVRSYVLEAGDAIFHSGDVLHCARENITTERREVVSIIYFADGARVMKPDHEHRRVDMEMFLPGLLPGDIAASDLNPLLYGKSD